MINDPRKMDFRNMQAEWESCERRLDAVCQIIKDMETIILSPNAFPFDKQDAQERMTIMQARKAYLINQQSEVENWLVENQAPGWTST